MSLKNWSVMSKFVSLLLLLGSVSLGGAYYATTQMRAIDTSYDTLINGPSVALLEGARANRAIMATIANIYRGIVSTDVAESKAAAEQERASVAAFDAKIAATARLYPRFAQRLEVDKRAFHAAYDVSCAETRHLAEATDAEGISKAAQAMHSSCQPALQTVVGTLIEMSNDMVLDMKRDSDRISADTGTIILYTLAFIVVGTIAVVALAVLFVRVGIVAHLRYVMSVMQSLGRGELALVVKGTDRGDELGAMSKSLDVLRSQLAESEAIRFKQAEADSSGKAQSLRRERLAQSFVDRMQTLAAGFAQSSHEVASAAKNLSATAEETSRQAQSVGLAAEDAAGNVNTVASASEQMASTVREITVQVAHSARVADSAFHEAEASNARIAELATAASAIGDVVNLIKGIADQTNLLALNATIEAARAGEAGRGFAVVASEVKQLAAQTSRATEDIGGKINEIQSATNGTVQSMKEIARTIANVKAIATSIASAVEEQGVATAEIASNCSRAAEGAAQVTQSISGVGQAAEMTGAASTQLMSLSSGLSTQAGDLRTAVELFVRELSAA